MEDLEVSGTVLGASPTSAPTVPHEPWDARISAIPRRELRPALHSSKVLREQDRPPGNRLQRLLYHAISAEPV